jgi:hypothetical protein
MRDEAIGPFKIVALFSAIPGHQIAEISATIRGRS